MSRGGSRRGSECGQFDQQAGPDGWAVAGGSGSPRPPSRAGDLSNFGKIAEAAPMTFGPSSVFAGKKDTKGRAETLTHKFQLEHALNLTRLQTLLHPNRAGRLAERQASTLVNLEYLKCLPNERDPISSPNHLPNIASDIDKLVTSAIESKETDAQIVGDLFSHTVSKDLCLSSAFEEGFGPTVELLDDIAIDTPKDFDLMAIMVKGAGLDTDDERRTRIATKSTNSNKLVALLA